jgi:ADP-ribose pyrophosphatase YjhB (NUDIX family)
MVSDVDDAAGGQRRVRCVGAVVRAGPGRLLLVLRARAPAAGTWSLPGGRVEPGETDAEAVRREVAEETGLDVEPGPLVGSVDRDGPGGVVYEIHDYDCTVTGGTLVAGDDAAEVRWVDHAAVRGLPCSPGLVETLTAWAVLPGR